MQIQLSDHFTYGNLFRFVTPSIVMMIFSSLFISIDDGLFVSNFVGKDAFVALNIMAPVISVISAFAFMIGTGGMAYVSKLLGEQKHDEAEKCFSEVVYFTAIASAIAALICLLLTKPYCILMGAEGAVYENCIKYATFMFPLSFAFLLQGIFQNFLIVAEKPTFAMVLTIVSGACNIAFDILLIVVLKLGIVGAVLATSSGPLLSTFIPLLYFVFSKKSSLKLRKTRIRIKEIGRMCYLGISQLIINLSMGLVSMVFNYRLMNLAGDDGVAAYGVIMYVSFIFVAAFIGYSMGIAPVVGYHYGATNHGELKNLFTKSIKIIAALGLVMTILAMVTARPLSMIFVSYDEGLLDLTVYAYRIYIISFLFAGFGIFAGEFFTALNDGITAGIISFVRTMIFQIGTVLLMPLVWGLDGVWYAPVVAEILATVVAALFIIKKREEYKYY